MTVIITPSREYIRECLCYFPNTGKLYWKHRPLNHFKTYRAYARWNGRFANKEAFTYEAKSEDGHIYRTGRINKILYKAHRIIYKGMTGLEAPETIDHKDGNGTNNKWDNIRPATNLQNLGNWHSLRKDNSSGYRGVNYDNKRCKWRARLGDIFIGRFTTIDEAITAYNRVAINYFGEYYNNVCGG